MATYFIDSVGGNDANNGTSKSTPWARAPGMKNGSGVAHTSGFGVVYTPATGDQFIFKGGVTWVASFCWNVTTGGTANAYTYYGAGDKSWFTGSSWTQPTFDFQNSHPSNDIGVLVSSPYNTFDNICFQNFWGPVDASGTNIAAFGDAIVSVRAGSGGSRVLVTNCLFKNYKNIVGVQPFGSNCTLSYCEFTQRDMVIVGTDGKRRVPWGSATWSVSYMLHNYFHEIGSVMAYSGGGEQAYNNLGPLYAMYAGNNVNADNGAHSNAFQLGLPGSCHDNYIHDLDGTVSPLSFNVAYLTTGHVVANAYCYNNVVANASQGWGFASEGSGDNSGITVYFYNNTTINAGNMSVDASIHGNTTKYAAAYVQNNLHIGNGTFSVNCGAVSGACVNDHNLHLSSAGSNYDSTGKPINASAPSVNAGVAPPFAISTDILGVTRPQNGIYDIGAYEWGGVPPPSQPTISVNPGSLDWGSVAI